MKVVLYPHSPAEKRLFAAFMNDMAELQEIERANTPNVPQLIAEVENAGRSQVEVAQPEQEAAAPAKKSRAKKTDAAPVVAEPTAESSSASATSSDPAAVGDPGNAAGTAPAEAGGTTEVTTDAPVASVTHDDLRKLYGEMVNAGKREAAVAAVVAVGAKSIKEIPDDKLETVHAAMKAVA